ncbi:UDP-N-acetylmuramoyl-L-alanyl-D-glutamate--2,6-diaminopimelate ligase [Bacillus andreraoultii]|uniref:UDP-N-acetylmuramoyl-L-alanyl-D-glutamate--2, 6-diaminopimelate ligase n=1 Tax=Bacillus andreraoultii TaxID=1499685 RepID=UPI0005396239|nr:UDP-N-acetylmuramoyl-L-alanyl-D-glutamate--2,6-diaminopimelate ligase [Bacillus andreraoultii]
MKLQTLLIHLPFAKQVNCEDNPEIKAIEQDTRKVKEGTLFICIEGAQFDGHKFAKEAESKGAVAILSNREVDVNIPNIIVPDTHRAMAIVADAFYRQPTHNLFLVGVTGTNGKTSVTHMVDHIFRSTNKKTGLIGTLYTKIGEKIFETKNTTPDSLTLQKTFREMSDEHVEVVSMEVSSHALAQGRVWGSDFDVAVFTNLTQDHLDYHKTMEEYKKAKGLLFSQLGNTYRSDRPKFAVLNVDDAATEEYKRVTSAHIITYGINGECDVRAKNLKFTSTGTSFQLETPVGNKQMSIRLVGTFNVYNVLAAISVGIVADISLDQIIDSLSSFQGVPGRFELVSVGQQFPVIVDYAHTPDSLENVLKTVRSLSPKRIFVVVGCGGDRDHGKRPLMAQIACKYATNPIFTSDNPRSEDPLAILKDMEAGVQGQTYQVIPDRRQAIHTAIHAANNGDVVLIAGKGHETYQIVGDKILDFDDRLVAKDALNDKQMTVKKMQKELD